MKIKKFRCRTFSQALKEIKRELGAEAVILSSEQAGENLVEVVAAVDREEAPSSQPAAGGGTELSELRREIERLRDALLQMKRGGYEMRLPEQRRRALKLLLRSAVREELALRLCERATDGDSLIKALSEELRTIDPDRSGRTIMLIGPTGVGKTTTLAKLAARSMRQGKRVAIITLDTYRIGAVEQLRVFSRLLGVPLEVASDVSELKRKINAHINRDRIFIDTAGRNPRDGSYLEELKAVYEIGIPVETQLLMSVSSDDAFMTEAYRYYRGLKIDCLGFTKADEAVSAGSIYNLSVLYQRPIAYITTGQRIPRDIDFPDSRRLAEFILSKGVNE